eukprot:SAG31_NODE_2206_length_6194_cov_3.730763_6_plen_81_part_00
MTCTDFIKNVADSFMDEYQVRLRAWHRLLSGLKIPVTNQQMAKESETMAALIDSAEAAAERKDGPPLSLCQSSERKQAQI